LARQWAQALRPTAYVPRSRAEIQHLLGELLDVLFGVLAVEELPLDRAKAVGRRLVSEYFTGEQSLRHTLEVLGQALPASPELQGVDDLARKVVSVVGAVTEGYVSALRALTLDQQERVKQALLRAAQDAEQRLRVSEAKFRELYTSSAVGIAISSLDGTLLETNQALREIVGDPTAELAGRSVDELLHPDDVAPLRSAYRKLVAGRGGRFRLPQRLRLIDKDGEPVWTYLAVSLLHDTDGRPAHQVTIVEDVNDLHLLGERLGHQSLHDALTGLANQQFFISRLERVLGRAELATQITVGKIDLNGLAVINDGFGREVGDQLLQVVAQRLQLALEGEKATVARFGSDEFAILIENSPTTPDLAALAASIDTQLTKPASIEGYQLAVSACVGFVEHQGGGEPAVLLRGAEAALHSVKRGGQRRWGSLDLDRDAAHRVRCRLAAALPGAWDSGDIVLDYRPLVQLTDGKIIAIEALMRWNHPHRAPLPHHECLELAAWTGLEVPLGQWLLRTACGQLALWQQRFGAAMPQLYADLTPRQSHDPDLVAGIRCALERAGLAPGSLQLGIPVLALGTGTGDAKENLQMLAEMGVAIVLSGFSGVGDVAYLEDLPVQAAEVAREAVHHAGQRPVAGSGIARAAATLVELVHGCGATVIVRGIQTRDEAGWWRSTGADVGQGGFYPPAGTPDEIAALLGSPRSGTIAAD
jgi:diguanylate cyclase (GGDEF)-like protein/PAS domain S-box-containing protein